MTTSQSPETSRPRLYLRLLSFLLVIVDIACIAGAWHGDGWIYDIIAAVPGAWSILNAYLIVIKRPIHPGFHIALDVVLTIVLWFFGILGLIGFMAWKGTSVHETAIAVFALMIVLGLVHLTLFVLACCDVHRRRHAASPTAYNTAKDGIEL